MDVMLIPTLTMPNKIESIPWPGAMAGHADLDPHGSILCLSTLELRLPCDEMRCHFFQVNVVDCLACSAGACVTLG